VFGVNKVAWRDLHSVGSKISSNGSHGSGSKADSSGERKKSKEGSVPEDLNVMGAVEMQQA